MGGLHPRSATRPCCAVKFINNLILLLIGDYSWIVRSAARRNTSASNSATSTISCSGFRPTEAGSLAGESSRLCGGGDAATAAAAASAATAASAAAAAFAAAALFESSAPRSSE